MEDFTDVKMKVVNMTIEEYYKKTYDYEYYFNLRDRIHEFYEEGGSVMCFFDMYIEFSSDEVYELYHLDTFLVSSKFLSGIVEYLHENSDSFDYFSNENIYMFLFNGGRQKRYSQN